MNTEALLESSQGWLNVFQFTSLCFCFAFLFWGLKLFKLYIRFLGFIIGAALGILLVFVFGFRSGAQPETILFLLLFCAAGGGALGAWVAWATHQFVLGVMVFVTAGGLGALLLMYAGLTGGVLLLGAIAIGGIVVALVMRVYERAIIAFFAVNAACSVLGYELVRTQGWDFRPEQIRENLGFFTASLVLLAVVYVWFAIVFQSPDKAAAGGNAVDAGDRERFRRLGLLLGGIALLTCAAERWLNFPGRSTVGFGLPGWPLVVFLMNGCWRWYQQKRAEFSRTKSPARDYLALLVLGLIVPSLASIPFSLVSGRLEFSSAGFSDHHRFLYSGSFPPALWGSFRYVFVDGPPLALWAFTLVIFPALLYWAMHSRFQTAPTRKAELPTKAPDTAPAR